MTHRRRGAIIMATLAGLLAAAGCSSFQAYPGDPLADEDVAFIDVRATRGSEVGAPILLAVDDYLFRDEQGRQVGDADDGVTVLPGTHTVEAVVPWSNGFRERVHLTFATEAGGTYFIQSFELPEHLDLDDVALAPLDPAGGAFEAIGGGLLTSIGQLGVPFWGPISTGVGILGGTTDEPLAADVPRQPSFVWAWEEDVWEPLAGTFPDGRGFAAPGSQRATR